MTEPSHPSETTPQTQEVPGFEAETPATQPEAAGGPEQAAPADPLTVALQEAAHWKDMAYRNAAELDNFRKRSARDAQETRAYANADLLRGILPILDNFEMGLEAARAESETSMIFMGMSMVQRQIADFLRDMGVQEVEALAKPFDPNLHDAVAQEASDTAAEGTVLRVSRRGYKLKDRLLRAASVVVSSGPPAAPDAIEAGAASA
ncbi:MAG TPA: nucleotide exchange factor GrpE [Verrucomicrobiales bacterium]|nr:nucleotide exchange factor GrpE [Verrucomicrobiales bacterium]HCN76035.1 nucleotide exchange factor GrpE [Verrucomicrobiales bacterium]HRJ08149.1 nucleotide exchange factor GrpE [Prosthecobacter sp.]HRK14123.1 nucleotide exchange factor GrpE [Prosthecobacter sp.]